MKICTGVELRDVIIDLKFKFENFRDFDVIRGQNSPFPIDFSRAPYHSAALLRCLWLLTRDAYTPDTPVDLINK